MKKEHVYISLIVLLLALNIFQLSAHFFSPQPPPNQRTNFKNMIPEILELNEDQKKRFFAMANEHRDQMRALIKQDRILILRYIDSPSESLLNEIADITTQKIKLTENHFSDVYNMLNDQQKGHFAKFKQTAFQQLSQ